MRLSSEPSLIWICGAIEPTSSGAMSPGVGIDVGSSWAAFASGAAGEVAAAGAASGDAPATGAAGADGPSAGEFAGGGFAIDGFAGGEGTTSQSAVGPASGVAPVLGMSCAGRFSSLKCTI